MHDCPRCKVPLHGHEEVCPSCGAKQIVLDKYKDIRVPKAPPINMMPFVLAALGIVVVIGLAAQGSWIGQLITHGSQKADPLDSLTPVQARQIIESQINKGLTAVGAKAKITYTADGSPADIALAKPVEMKVETKLTAPDQHKAIIDPIKQYMEKGLIPSLVMTDAKSHATWTYSCSLTPPTAGGADQNTAPDASAAGAPDASSSQSQ